MPSPEGGTGGPTANPSSPPGAYVTTPLNRAPGTPPLGAIKYSPQTTAAIAKELLDTGGCLGQSLYNVD